MFRVSKELVSRRSLLRTGLGVGVYIGSTGCVSTVAGTTDSNPETSPLRASTAATAATAPTAAPTASTVVRTSQGVPPPAGMIRSSWSTDPFTLGSYSYLPVGATPKLRTTLSTPVNGRLFFAGEALDPDNPATVHGAAASGRMAALLVRDVSDAVERIVVIGAGIAGVTAARALADEGHQVTVLEAQRRVGGRIHTTRPEGWPLPVELGANWVHDATGNDLFARLKSLGVATVISDHQGAVLGADGTMAVDGFMDSAADAVDTAIGWADTQDVDMSLAAAINRSGAGIDVDAAALAHYLRTEVTSEYGVDASGLSAWWGTDEGTNGQELLVLGGYGTLVDELAAGLDIRLGWSVATVSLLADSASVVSSDGEVLQADRVVVTVPLGVLKARGIRFDPELPSEHLAAIDAMGMGVLDKVWLRWDKPWWRQTTEQWTRVASADDSFIEWYNLAELADAPVLLGLLAGPEALAWSSRSDGEVLSAALASLDRFYSAGW